MNTCSHNHHDFKANDWFKHLAVVSSLDSDLRDVAVVETLVVKQDAMSLILMRVPTWWDKAEFIPISCVGILHSLTKDHQHTTLKNKQNNVFGGRILATRTLQCGGKPLKFERGVSNSSSILL